jgi:hypothetical protein
MCDTWMHLGGDRQTSSILSSRVLCKYHSIVLSLMLYHSILRTTYVLLWREYHFGHKPSAKNCYGVLLFALHIHLVWQQEVAAYFTAALSQAEEAMIMIPWWWCLPGPGGETLRIGGHDDDEAYDYDATSTPLSVAVPDTQQVSAWLTLTADCNHTPGLQVSCSRFSILGIMYAFLLIADCSSHSLVLSLDLILIHCFYL